MTVTKKVKILNVYTYLVSIIVNNYIGASNFALNLITYFISGRRNIVALGRGIRQLEVTPMY